MRARQFEIQLKAELAAKIDDVHEFVQLIGLHAVRSVVLKSPVKEGRFKGNWNLSIGSEDLSTSETFDKGGQTTIARAEGALSAYAASEGFPVVYLTNNLPYAGRLEDGYSGQAPSGMVGLTVAEIQAAFDGAEI